MFVYNVVNSDDNASLDETNMKLAQLKYNFGSNSNSQKVYEHKAVIIEYLDDPELGKGQDNSTNEDRIPILVDKKYCTKCNLEQPLRTKHCKDCKK
jgi:hypothetical protein